MFGIDDAIFAGASLAMSAGGTGLSIFGASKQAAAQKQIALLEQSADAQRRKAMEVAARRQEIENGRNVQRARSMGLATATAQGGEFGSGLQGGQAQAAGQGNWNQLGIQQSLQTGETLFDINGQISQQKIKAGQAATLSSIGSGLTSLGGSMMGSLNAMSRLSGGLNVGGTGWQSSGQGTQWGMGSINSNGMGYY